MTDSNIALLIDYENVGIDSLQYLVEQISGMGRIIVKRAYADWSSERKGQERLIELGVEAVHNYRTPRSGKNSCDIKLTIDAVELLHSAQVDTFVIVSSDSDFVPLVNHLRGSGKSVVGAGRKAVTSTTMVKSCDRYIFLDPHTIGLQKPNSTARNNTRRATPYRDRRQAHPQHDRQDSERSVEQLLIKAVEATVGDDGNSLGTRLAQTMTRIDPGFDYKELGFRSFREFLTSRDEIEVTFREGTDFTVSIKNSDSNTVNEKEKLAPARKPSVSPRIISFDKNPSDQDSDSLPDNWEEKVNTAWESKEKDQLSGQAAANQAAKIMGFQRLRDSLYPTIDKLLDASILLKENWARNKNYVTRKK
ncbi:MAG: NYN domain-containing protein [SAR202 cluster bacterium]|nr:MAG: NYN domain-containing protein [SAR202 cluster bacterium]MEE3345950.1 NYN domain-containing protein [Chloroflexota bacterium]